MEQPSQIQSALGVAADRAADGSRRAAFTAETAQTGSAKVEAMVARMGQIQSPVQQSASKVQAIGQRSEQIAAIINTIGDIATSLAGSN